MSFEAIVQDYKPKTQTVVISHNGKDYHFTAVEISVLAQQEIGLAKQNGEEWLTKMVAASIVDSDGKHMTVGQAEKLSQEHATKFLEAALAVNKQGAEEKK